MKLTSATSLAYPQTLQRAEINHYSTLGLDRDCTEAQIRNAYRILAKQQHPDLNPSPEALEHTQALNAAYEILSDPACRQAYDAELASLKKSTASRPAAKLQRNLAQDVSLRMEDFLRGTTLDVSVKDPAAPNGREVYQLTVPPGTTPGARFRIPRGEPFAGGFVTVRVRALSDFRFKVRGSDLRCDLRIKPERAARGGTEMIQGVNGTRLRLMIPNGVGRGEIIRISGEGLPKARGGRGDLLVRVLYRPQIRVTRTMRR